MSGEGPRMHPGIAMAAPSAAAPILAFAYGEAGAARIGELCRAHLTQGRDPEAVLDGLEQVAPVGPGIELDADGLIEDILPEGATATMRWNAFFYGHCRSAHHPEVEGILRRDAGIETLAEGFDTWCPPETGRALNAAIDAAERQVAQGRLNALDREVLALLGPSPAADATYPIYRALIDHLRIRHVQAVLARLTPEGADRVRAILREATA